MTHATQCRFESLKRSAGVFKPWSDTRPELAWIQVRDRVSNAPSNEIKFNNAKLKFIRFSTRFG